MAEAEAIPAKKVRPIHPNRFSLTEGAVRSWYAVVDAGVPLSAVLEPGYWANIASRLQPHNRITVDAEDQAYTAELFVRSVSKMAATVSVLSKVEFDPAEAKPAGNLFKAMWKGPHHKWAVVAVEDEKTIKQGGFENEAKAMEWIGLNSRSLAA